MPLARTDDSVHRERAAKASDRLLASLRRHHGEEEPPVVVPVTESPNVPGPVAPTNVEATCRPMDDWAERQKDIWFSIEGEIEGGKPTVRDVQLAVCREFKVSMRDLLSERRTVDIVLPRQVGYYLSKKLTGRSLPDIGRRFGRDHTSALSGIRKIERLRKTDVALDARLVTVASSLGGSLA